MRYAINIHHPLLRGSEGEINLAQRSIKPSNLPSPRAGLTANSPPPNPAPRPKSKNRILGEEQDRRAAIRFQFRRRIPLPPPFLLFKMGEGAGTFRGRFLTWRLKPHPPAPSPILPGKIEQKPLQERGWGHRR